MLDFIFNFVFGTEVVAKQWGMHPMQVLSVALCRSALQCVLVLVRCSVLPCVALGRVSHAGAVSCCVLQYVAARCSVL